MERGKKCQKGITRSTDKTQNYLRVKDHDAYKLFLKDSRKKKVLHTHTYRVCKREWEHEYTNSKANRSKCYQQVKLVQEYTGILYITLIFDNLSISLKSLPNNRFLKFRFTLKKKKIKSCKLHSRDLGYRVLKSYQYHRWYRFISTVLLSFSLTSPMPKLYKILKIIF